MAFTCKWALFAYACVRLVTEDVCILTIALAINARMVDICGAGTEQANRPRPAHSRKA